MEYKAKDCTMKYDEKTGVIHCIARGRTIDFHIDEFLAFGKQIIWTKIRRRLHGITK